MILRVIPAKAGIHPVRLVKKACIPFFKERTIFCSDVMLSAVRDFEFFEQVMSP